MYFREVVVYAIVMLLVLAVFTLTAQLWLNKEEQSCKDMC